MPSLHELYVYYCRRSECVPNSAFTTYLDGVDAKGQPLEVVDVSMNYMGANGMIPLLDLVRNTKTVRVLNMSRQFLEGAQLEHLVDCLATHPCISTVVLADNHLHDGCLDALQRLLEANSHITEVDLSSNEFSSTALATVEKLLHQNAKKQAALAAEEKQIQEIKQEVRQASSRRSFEVAVHDAVEASEAGGCPHFASWWKNPQYKVSQSRTSRVRVTLEVTGDIVAAREVGFVVLRHDGLRRVMEPTQDVMVLESAMHSERCSGDAVLDANEHYVVVPFAFSPGKGFSFKLTVTLLNDKPSLEEGWVTAERLEKKYDWCITESEGEWTPEDAGGSAESPLWRNNHMFRIGGVSTPTLVHVLLYKHCDPDFNDEVEIGLDVVHADPHGNGHQPPLRCTPETRIASFPHERRTCVSMQLQLEPSVADVYVVPSALTCTQYSPYTLVVSTSTATTVTESTFPHGWYQRRLRGQWEAAACGGCRELYASWKNNPSVRVEMPAAACVVYATLDVVEPEPAEVALQEKEEVVEVDPERVKRQQEIALFKERHRTATLLVGLTAVDAEAPLYATRGTAPLAVDASFLEVANTASPFYVVPMTQHAGSLAAFVLQLFSATPFVVDGVEVLATRERESQLNQYKAQSTARASQQQEQLQALLQPTIEIPEECLRGGDTFTDRDFPRGFSSLFLDPDSPPPLRFPVEYSWRRATELCADPRCLDGERAMSAPFPHHQRSWFASVLYALSAKPSWLARVYGGYDRQRGIASFRFFKGESWDRVLVDDYLLVDGLGELVQGRSTVAEDFFYPLAEKAYAKLHRCYECMEFKKVTPQLKLTDVLGQGLADLTGGLTTVWQTRRMEDGAEVEGEARDALWREMKTAIDQHVLCTVLLQSGDKTVRERSHVGLLPDVLYGVVDVRFVEQQRLVKLLNWQDGEETKWKGMWADGSSKWTGTLSEALDVRPGEGDREAIWIHFDELVHYFTDVLLTRVYDRVTVAEATSHEEIADPEDTDIQLRNPQYALKVELAKETLAEVDGSVDIVIGLHRRDGRLDITRAKGATAQYKTAVGMAVLATEDNQRRVRHVSDKNIAQLVRPNKSRDIYTTITVPFKSLTTACYTVMPFPEYERDAASTFLLSARCVLDSVSLSLIHAEQNHATTVDGTWPSSSGSTAPSRPIWRDNQQFFLLPSEAMEVAVYLRAVHPNGVMGFTIHKATQCRSLLFYDEESVVAKAEGGEQAPTCTAVLRVAGTAERRGMPYIIVPYCTDPSPTHSQFTLEVVANRSLKLSPVEARLDWHRVHQRVSISAAEETAGGGPAFPSWRYSPQYELSFPVERDGPLLITATNANGKDDRNALGLMVLKADMTVAGGRRRRLCYREADIVARSAECVGRVELNFAVTVAPEEPLVLVVYTTQPYREVEVDLSFYSAPSLEVRPVLEWRSVVCEEGQWELGKTAGGSRANFASWINNPFFAVTVLRPTRVVAVLVQYPRGTDHPIVKRYGNRKAMLPPPLCNEDRHTSIQLDVVRYDTDLSPVCSAGPTTEAEVVLVSDMDTEEKLLLVPCTTIPEVDADYKLFLYADYPVDLYLVEKPRLPYV